MKELVFLLEEPSARAMLDSLLPRFLNKEITHRLIPFEGKQDLEKQITRKIRGYLNPLARFIVIRDQDNNPNCLNIKKNLIKLCGESGRGHHCLVRIACTEIETFYLADLLAVENALEIPELSRYQQSKKFRAPDYLGCPSRELRILTKNKYEKVRGSRLIGGHLQIDNERSPSFKNLIAAIRRMESDLLNN